MKQQTRVLVLLAAVLTAQLASAELVYVYHDATNSLVRFDSATPGTTTTIPLSGFPGTTTVLFGIDFRPSNGFLYGRATDGGLNGTTVIIDTATGVMTAVGGPQANGGGSFYGFDFDPVADVIRFTSTASNNRRFNPNDGTLLATDTALATPDANVAYSNNVAGAATTTLYGINHVTDFLETINPPTAGTTIPVGPLGVDAPDFGGFDISGATGIAYAVFRVGGSSGLYTIDLTTGAATLVGAIGNGTLAFNGLAVQPRAQLETSFQVRYAANVGSTSLIDSYVNITNTGRQGAGLASGVTASVTGSLCANVYVFSPDEQMVSCCSCPVTPNGLVSLSTKADLLAKTLTPAVPSSIVVKILSTLPVAGSCNNSASLAGGAPLAPGLLAWGTTSHANAVGGPAAAITETRFSPATLSAGEFNRMRQLCGFILANGSGYGVCSTCRFGALGAARQ